MQGGNDNCCLPPCAQRVYIPLPEAQARAQMFKIHLGDTPHGLTAVRMQPWIVLRLAHLAAGALLFHCTWQPQKSQPQPSHVPQSSQEHCLRHGDRCIIGGAQ